MILDFTRPAEAPDHLFALGGLPPPMLPLALLDLQQRGKVFEGYIEFGMIIFPITSRVC